MIDRLIVPRASRERASPEWDEPVFGARSRGDLCRAIARDPSEGMVPEGGARPMIVDDHENRSVTVRGPTLFPMKSTLLVYLEMVIIQTAI